MDESDEQKGTVDGDRSNTDQGSLRRLKGCLPKPDGKSASIEEMNDAVAEAAAETITK